MKYTNKYEFPIYEDQDIVELDKYTDDLAEKLERATKNQDTRIDEQSLAIKTDIELMINQIPIGQASGESIVLKDSSNLPYKKFNIGGHSVQEGEPTPEAPVEIKSCGDEGTVEIKQSEKNLLKGLSTSTDDADYWHDVNRNYFTSLEDGWGKFDYDNTSGTSTVFVNAKVKLSAVELKENTTYTMVTEIRNSSISENAGAFFQLVTNNSAVAFQTAMNLGYQAINAGGKYTSTIVTKESFSGVEVAIDTYLRLGAGTKGTVEARISLIEGDVDVDTFEYEPYFSNDYIIQVSEPLRSLLNGVCDTIEKDGIHRRVGSIVLDGSENWWEYTNYPGEGKCYQIEKDDFALVPINSISYIHSYCSHFKNAYSVWGYGTSKVGTYSDHGTAKRKYFISDKETLEEWKAWLSENPITLIIN